MLLVTTAAEAAARCHEVHVNGRDYVLAEYIGAAPKRGHYVAGNEANDNGLPQGFLVHQPPHAVTPAHFHEPNQFQVFVGGAGRMGAYPAQPLTVQYANGHTPYGPIVAGEQGVKYFTLRQQWDPGAKYLPAAKDLLRTGNQRTRIKGGIEAAGAGPRDTRGGNRIDTIFEPEADGLAAWIWRMPATNKALLPNPAEGGGQYLIVAGGTMLHLGRTLDHLSTIYITADEPPFWAAAGEDGLDLLVLQFPRLGATISGGASRDGRRADRKR